MLTGLAAATALPTLLSSTFVHAQSHSPAMGDAEKKHAEDTKKVGSLSLAISRVATEKASDGMVKSFAKWEVAEQETITDIYPEVHGDGRKGGGSAEAAVGR
ncbi:hypothetical protein GGE46_005852 [Rhizobium etli]|uniref:Uncharacterized protein n=2 Tax=Rhizobium/Agrobacterium group TaxID=227290 RepID=A0A7W6VFF7_RHIET|nr:hypothetical protein [Rhizobium etli]MBB4483231.1 hypothetical protein [Rhizobium etli]MBB4539060.1 hypothetical protein [Rhizobium etli]